MTEDSYDKQMAVATSLQIVSGKVSPRIGGGDIWVHYGAQSDDIPDDLLTIVGAVSSYEDAPEFEARFDQDIREEAQRLVDENPEIVRGIESPRVSDLGWSL